MLLAGVVLKLVPVIITVVLIGPEAGVKEVMVGNAGATVTVKLVVLVAVFPLTVTVIVPVVAPVGTEVVMEVAVLAVTTAVVPLNATELLTGVVLKLVPVMVTVVPTEPETGANDVMVGSRTAPIVKSVVLVTLRQFVDTDIFPVVVPDGTVTVMLVAALAVMVAVLLLKKVT